ncbi:MAG TPA: ABC transporter permease, partial [Bacteroidetes bacterium]|nr:ABC transporter permease [Bacteroidota bacterium]
MKAIFIIIRKELLDTVRDRRTLMVMVIIPLLLFPMILIVVSQIQAASSKDEAVKELTIGFSGGVEDLGLRDMLKEMPGFTLTEVTEADSLSPLIQRGQLDLGVSILPDFEHLADGRGTGKVLALYEDTEEGARERLKIVMDMFETQMVARRLDSLGLTADNIHPVEIIRENVAPKEQLIGKYIGGFLPYIFIIFCFMGCMFPAIDLFTGEKERGSMETILSVPVDRWKILVGKMTVVVIAGMSTAFLALIGLFVGMQITDTLPQEFMDLILDILSP